MATKKKVKQETVESVEAVEVVKVVNALKLQNSCNVCDHYYTSAIYRTSCPECGAANTKVVQ
jgi:Zn finger protein HypA/HybF involved in hydrogenase expression